MSEQQIFNGNLALKKTPRVVVIPPNETVRGRKLRVAAYVRVSSNSSDQLNSYAAQNAHYTELITSNSDWDFVDVYADKGITGTSAEKRDDFQRLLQDCRRGRIDLVLTKSSSRFARNTKESLEAARELKALGMTTLRRQHGHSYELTLTRKEGPMDDSDCAKSHRHTAYEEKPTGAGPKEKSAGGCLLPGIYQQ